MRILDLIDYEAIKKTHEHANRCGHRVVADDDAEYYIGVITKSINVSTDVNGEAQPSFLTTEK